MPRELDQFASWLPVPGEPQLSEVFYAFSPFLRATHDRSGESATVGLVERRQETHFYCVVGFAAIAKSISANRGRESLSDTTRETKKESGVSVENGLRS